MDVGIYYLLYYQAVQEAATICPTPCKLTFNLLTSKVVSESCVTYATFVPILVFIGLSAQLNTDRRTSIGPRLRPDVRDRQTDVRRQTHFIA